MFQPPVVAIRYVSGAGQAAPQRLVDPSELSGAGFPASPAISRSVSPCSSQQSLVTRSPRDLAALPRQAVVRPVEREQGRLPGHLKPPRLSGGAVVPDVAHAVTIASAQGRCVVPCVPDGRPTPQQAQTPGGAGSLSPPQMARRVRGDTPTFSVSLVDGTKSAGQSGKTSPCSSVFTGEADTDISEHSPRPQDPESAPEESPEDESAWGFKERTFKAYCGKGPDMAGKSFAKLCTDCGLVDGAMTVSDVDIIFAKVVTKGQRRIGAQQFDEALLLLAEKKGVDIEDILRHLRRTHGPVLKSTRTETVRFHDDKSTYTGTHAQGPESVGKGRMTLSTTLPAGAHEDTAIGRDRSPARALSPSGFSPPSRAPSRGPPPPGGARRASKGRVDSDRTGSPSPPGAVARQGHLQVKGGVGRRDSFEEENSRSASPMPEAAALRAPPLPTPSRQPPAMPRGTVEDTFRAYCGTRPDMDGANFAKLCKDCHLADGGGLNPGDSDIIFAKVVPRGHRRIDMQQFTAAMQLIAEKKGVNLAVVNRAVAASAGPVLKCTKAEAVRFHDDKSQYTGTHVHGGPDTGSKSASRSDRESNAFFASLRADRGAGPGEDDDLPERWQKRCAAEQGGSRSPTRMQSSTRSDASEALRPRRVSSCASPAMRQSGARPPMGTDEVTMVFTDVQGSTSLWEANASAMEQALKLHDATIRQVLARHGGYEVTTEGDAFQVCFHTAGDAVAFCLDVQTELMGCNWPSETLEHSDAIRTEDHTWNGLRVRMGVHSGKPASVTKHEMTGRWRYAGPSVAMAKAVEGTCHGGQIVLSHECYQLVDGQLTQLGSPQVIDLGEHLLEGQGIADPSSGDEGKAVVRLVQLVPESLAYDYSTETVSEPGTASSPGGRVFPPIISKERRKPGFDQSPSGPSITLCFVFTKGAQDLVASAPALGALSLGILRRCVRDLLQLSEGYECQEDEGAFMLAFQTMGQAAAFGIALQRELKNQPWSPELKTRGLAGGLKVAVGALSGGYTSRRPHFSTGRADYFGTIVNRTARIAASANSGQVLLGGEEPLGGQVVLDTGCQVRRLGAFTLKGIDSPMVLSEIRIPDEEGRYEDFPEPKTKGRVSD